MTTAVRTANPFRTLARHRNFRLFWFGQTISLVGTWMQQIATGWLALELTNSAFMVGLVAAAGTIPILLFALPAGVLADRSDKLRVVRIAQTMMLVEASVLWGFTWSGRITIDWLLALVLFGGLLSSVEIPARQSLIIDLVVKDDLLDAIALNSGGFNLARILGPTVAALVIASLGLSWCFGFNALSYLAVLVGLALIRLPGRDSGLARVAHPSAIAGMLEALRYVRNDRLMWILMRIVAVFSVLSVPILTLLPVVARDQLHLGVSGYGLLMTCYGVGATLGALAIASQGGRAEARAHADGELARPRRRDPRLLALALRRVLRHDAVRHGHRRDHQQRADQHAAAAPGAQRTARQGDGDLRDGVRGDEPGRVVRRRVARLQRGCLARDRRDGRADGAVHHLGVPPVRGTAAGLRVSFPRAVHPAPCASSGRAPSR